MRIVVSVSNDIVTDQRVHRVCNTLVDNGYTVVLLGRKKRKSPDLDAYSFKAKRFRLLFEKGPCFYACLNIRLFMFLLFAKADIFLSNDLDTLPANYLAAKIRKIKLVYDSHELFTEVPELMDREKVRKIWLKIEKRILPHIKHSYTVCESIARYYNELYGINMQVIRNLPTRKEEVIPFSLRENIIIYQGVLNKGRGLENLIEAMKQLPEITLLIAGSGDIEAELHLLANSAQNIKFLGRIAPSNLHSITSSAKLGFSLEEDLGLNYRYALPNKLFDYIQAGTPVVVSNLPEMRAVIKDYVVGWVVEDVSAIKLSAIIKELIVDEDCLFSAHINCCKAAKVLIWEEQKYSLLSQFEK